MKASAPHARGTEVPNYGLPNPCNDQTFGCDVHLFTGVSKWLLGEPVNETVSQVVLMVNTFLFHTPQLFTVSTRTRCDVASSCCMVQYIVKSWSRQ